MCQQTLAYIDRWICEKQPLVVVSVICLRYNYTGETRSRVKRAATRRLSPIYPPPTYNEQWKPISTTNTNKKLSCGREASWCFESLNISLSHWRSLKMVPLESLGTVFYPHYIAAMALPCVIFEIKRYICRKSRFCHTPPTFDNAVRRSPLEYYHKLWYGKLGWCSYLTVKKFENMFARFDTMHERDGQTDRRTQASRGKMSCQTNKPGE